jgi:flagellar L-ring protein precursor FlgH
VWSKDNASPYSTEKAYKVGDIVSIIVSESTNAQNRAGTKSDVKDNFAAKLTHTIQKLAPIIGMNNQVGGELSNKYSGDGQTSRVSKVQTRISAWVTEVLPNGNLLIKGRHKVEVNGELQEINFSGIIRPKDISGANTIFSYQVANAELSVKGSGTVAESEFPGLISRFLNWLF